MWGEAVRTAVVGFAVVFATLFILALCVKFMSGVIRVTTKKGGK